MSICFFSGGHGTYVTRPAAGHLEQQVHQIPVRDRLEPADVEDLAVGAGHAPARRNASAASSTKTKSRICEPSPNTWISLSSIARRMNQPMKPWRLWLISWRGP